MMKPGDLTTLPALKSWLDIKGNEFDDDLERLITAISLFVKNWVGRSLLLAEYTEKRSGAGGPVLMLNQYPILSITSLQLDGHAILPAQYSFDDNGIYLINGVFTRAKNNIVVVYQAGYDGVPADVEQAVIETAALRWKERGRIGMTSKGMAGETTNFVISDFPPSAKSILNDYMRVVAS